jgi:hypothetical protein
MNIHISSIHAFRFTLSSTNVHTGELGMGGDRSIITTKTTTTTTTRLLGLHQWKPPLPPRPTYLESSTSEFLLNPDGRWQQHGMNKVIMGCILIVTSRILGRGSYTSSSSGLGSGRRLRSGPRLAAAAVRSKSKDWCHLVDIPLVLVFVC